MGRSIRLVAAMLLMLWAVCAAHCKIGSLAGSSGVPCCDGDGFPESVPNHCVCSTLQAGAVSERSQVRLTLASVAERLFTDETLEIERSVAVFSRTTLSASPLLPEHWQFLYQTASPPRAPSCS